MAVTLRGMVNAFVAARGLDGHPAVNYLREFADFVVAAAAECSEPIEGATNDSDSLTMQVIRELVRVTEISKRHANTPESVPMVVGAAIVFARSALTSGDPTALRLAAKELKDVQ